jgi:hypothetical protein
MIPITSPDLSSYKDDLSVSINEGDGYKQILPDNTMVANLNLMTMPGATTWEKLSGSLGNRSCVT